MPLVRISLREKRSQEYLRAIADGVHAAMVEALGIPREDRFQILSDHGVDLVYDPGYLGIERTDGIVIIQVTLNLGRSVEQKKALYKQIAERLADDPGIRPADVFVNLVEVPRENWSFGNGEAQYA